jgi:hypothetical protein
MKSPISVGHDSLSVTAGTALGLSAGAAGIPANATKADIFTDQDIRIWLDGTAPTATTGMKIDAGTIFELESRNEIENIRAIAVSESAALMINYKDA